MANPSEQAYWEAFYAEGGVGADARRRPYEWYGLPFPVLAPHLNRQLPVLGPAAARGSACQRDSQQESPGRLLEMVQIGVGSSPILQVWTEIGAREFHELQVREARQFRKGKGRRKRTPAVAPSATPSGVENVTALGRPSGLNLINIDVCKEVIDEMRVRFGDLAVSEGCSLCRLKCASASESSCQYVASTSWVVDDATKLLTLKDDSIDVVFDKGTVDALLSHGADEFGEFPPLSALFSSVARCLRSGGRWLLVSGNEPSLILPYVYATKNESAVECLDFTDNDSFREAWTVRDIIILDRTLTPDLKNLSQDDGSLTRGEGDEPVAASFTGLNMRMFVLERI